MTSWDLDFLPEALDDLADIWIEATDADAVTAAAAWIEKELRRNPTAVGRYLSEGLYNIHRSPLVIYFTLDVANRTVEVSRVARRD